MPLWAVHISDGVLAWPWLTGGFALAGILACLGSRCIRDEEIPRVAVLTAVFYVASLIHVRVPPTSVHLLLNGLVGLVLGWRAALAIPVGLFLQAALFSHGGFTTLGINSCIMVVPALLAWQMFAVLQRVPWVRLPWFRAGLVAASIFLWLLSLGYGVILLVAQTKLSWMLGSILNGLPGSRGESMTLPTTSLSWANVLVFHPVVLAGAVGASLLAAWVERRLDHAPEFPLGLLIGQVTVLATTFLNCLVLAWGGQENWQTLAEIVFVAHLPIAVVEGMVLGFTVGFLVRVKPEMLRWAPPKEAQCAVDSLP